MKKITITGLLWLFPLMIFSQNDSSGKTSLTGQWLKNRIMVYAGGNFTAYNPVQFYNQNPSHQLGWEIGVGYKIFGNEGADMVVGLSRSYYSFQSERRHKDILHVVHHMAYQNSMPVYVRMRLGNHSLFHLNTGFRLVFWSYYYYTYDIYKNSQSAQLVYHQQSKAIRRNNSPRFVSYLYLHTDLEYRFYKNVGIYLSADMSKQSRVGIGLTWML